MENVIDKIEPQEEKVNIAAALEEDRDESKDKEIAHELACENINFYVLNGGINAIWNKGSIKGDIFQGNKGKDYHQNGNEKDEMYYNFYEEKDVKRFIEEYSHREELIDLLSVTFLDCIPVFLWEEIKGKLRKCIASGNDNKSIEVERFSSIAERLELLHMLKTSVRYKTPTGDLEVDSIIFFDEKIHDTVEKVVWKEYYEIRTFILLWLDELREDDKVGRTMKYQLMKTYGRIAVYDWTFFERCILDKWIQNESYINRNYIVSILKFYIEKIDYNPSVDRKLKQWISEGEKFLWDVVYRLYNMKEKYEFNSRIQARMQNDMEKDVHNRCLGEGIVLARGDYLVDIFPAYYSKPIQELLINCLIANYEKKTKYIEQGLIADYFAWLLTIDYKISKNIAEPLLFVNMLNRRDISLKVKEFYLKMWKKYRVRKIWVKIITMNFQNIEKNRTEWFYMKEFFKIVAITGEKEDYKLVLEILYKIDRSIYVVREVEEWLKELWEERKNDYTNI